jgi:hypothetical protein
MMVEIDLKISKLSNDHQKLLNSLFLYLNMFKTATGIFGSPPIRPLETLHNALSLKQLDNFLEKMTSYVPTIKLGNMDRQMSIQD